MIRLHILKLLLFSFLFSLNLSAQGKADAEKIKEQKIRSVKKISTDLKVSENFIPRTVSVITYDKNGNQAEHLKYTPDGNIEMIFTYTYDERGNTIEVTGRLPDGKIGNKWTYEYDENNNLVRQTSYRPDGIIGRDYIFTYDENGIRQSELIYDNKQLIEQAEYIYEFYEEE
jgi:antitoxin component YwqK of YwqJK toxin-antitoxin module